MKLLIAGDYVPQNRIAEKLAKHDFSFLECFQSELEKVDYAIVNMEAPVSDDRIAQPIEKTGPNLFVNEVSLEFLNRVGFDCVTLANNHFRDFGQPLVESTIDLCKKWLLAYVGGGTSLESARKYLVVKDECNNKTIAIINACEYEWSIATPLRGGSNPLDIVDICCDLKKAKSKCDYVLLIIHGGVEWYNLPTPQMQKLYRFFVDQGADAIINHHQHCISGYEVYNGRPIFYGLGNFCFDKGKMKRTFWHEGLVVLLELDSNIRFSVIPIIQCAEDATVAFYPEDSSILDKIRELNAIINNTDLLVRSFQKFIEEAGRSRISILQPWGGTVLERFYSHGLLPGLLSREWKKRALSLFRCESNREVLLNHLENQFK